MLSACTKNEGPAKPVPVRPDIEAGTIPVIFHVMYQDPSNTTQNPPAEVFAKKMEQLNKFYAADPTLFMPGTPGAGAESQNVGIRFVLATHDPFGNRLEEPGIVRDYYTGAANLDVDKFIRLAPLPDQKNLWNPNWYVNIWLFGFHAGTDGTDVTGVSYLPYATMQHPLALLNAGDMYLDPTVMPTYMHGISLNNKYLQAENGEGAFVLFHEMGHYLGLRHAFQDRGCGTNPADDAEDDGCEDTKKYDRYTYQSLLFAGPLPYAQEYRQPCDGSGLFLSTNVMDYFVGYRTNLTLKQKERIDHVMAYSPWIPRPKALTRALREAYPGELPTERPVPIVMY